MLLRRATTIALTSLALVVGASCDDGHYGRRECDGVAHRCATVCNYWCDDWGCWPTCWGQCWDDDCRPPSSSPERPDPVASVPDDAGAAAEASSSAPPDGGRSGTGVLCAACASNDDCQAGALCIFRGGASPDASAPPPDAGRPQGSGFCGHACEASSECPVGFGCVQIGATRQCLPNDGVCN